MRKIDRSQPGSVCPTCGLVPARPLEELHRRECAHWRVLCLDVPNGTPHHVVKGAWEGLLTTLVR
jgi:hypothetical protein